jgi:tetratricopeptide (TPR) repeat protein
MIRYLYLLIVFIFVPNSLIGQGFDFNKDCHEAYQHIISLRLKNGEVIIAGEKLKNPSNQMTVVLENYIDFFKIFISEDKQQFDILKVNKEKRLLSISENPSDSPIFLWSQATINLQWAFVRLKFGEYYSAAFELRRAFIQLENNEKRYPDFLPNKLLLGLLHALVGSIPDEYQWIVKLASMNGSVNDGIGEMKKVLLKCGNDVEFGYLREEAMFFLGFAELNLLAEPDDSLLLLNSFKPIDSTNLLMVFLKATIEMRTGKNDAASQTLHYRPKGEEYFPFYYLIYLEAESMLRRLDLNAKILYRDFIINFKGFNYRQDAIRKLAWIGLIEGDLNKYHEWISQVPKQKSGQVEADKQAVREADGLSNPDIELLKSRLLFDGGYYPDALEILTNAAEKRNNSELAVRLEYSYRLGRIFHEMKKYDEALENYQVVLITGINSKLYYPANAALKSGEIYEITHQKQKAIENYHLCLKLKPDEYKSGIHQKAEAGISRLTSGE